MACLARSTFSAKSSAVNRTSTRSTSITTTRSALPPAFVDFAPVTIAKDALAEQVAFVEAKHTSSVDLFGSFVKSAPMLDIREQLDTADRINDKADDIKRKAEAQLDKRQGPAGVFNALKGNPLKPGPSATRK